MISHQHQIFIISNLRFPNLYDIHFQSREKSREKKKEKRSAQFSHQLNSVPCRERVFKLDIIIRSQLQRPP